LKASVTLGFGVKDQVSLQSKWISQALNPFSEAPQQQKLIIERANFVPKRGPRKNSVISGALSMSCHAKFLDTDWTSFRIRAGAA